MNLGSRPWPWTPADRYAIEGIIRYAKDRGNVIVVGDRLYAILEREGFDLSPVRRQVRIPSREGLPCC